MISRLRIALVLGWTVLLGSCANESTAPAASHGLAISVFVGPPIIGISRDQVFHVQLLNVSDEEITLVFGTTCTILGYVSDLRGKIVYPSHGAYACADAISRVTLAPGRGISRQVVFSAEQTTTPTSSTIILPPGRYRAYAEMDAVLEDVGGPRVTLRAPSALFRLPWQP